MWTWRCTLQTTPCSKRPLQEIYIERQAKERAVPKRWQDPDKLVLRGKQMARNAYRIQKMQGCPSTTYVFTQGIEKIQITKYSKRRNKEAHDNTRDSSQGTLACLTMHNHQLYRLHEDITEENLHGHNGPCRTCATPIHVKNSQKSRKRRTCLEPRKEHLDKKLHQASCVMVKE